MDSTGDDAPNVGVDRRDLGQQCSGHDDRAQMGIDQPNPDAADAGHFGYLERPEIVNKVLVDFLR